MADTGEIMNSGAEFGVWSQDWEACKALCRSDPDAGVIMNFTGSDWCGWCKLMDKNVFALQEWKDEARARKYVLAYIDFPRDPSKVPEEFKPRNRQLQEEYGVRENTYWRISTSLGIHRKFPKNSSPGIDNCRRNTECEKIRTGVYRLPSGSIESSRRIQAQESTTAGGIRSARKYVLAYIDFPRDPSKVPEEFKPRNRQLQEEYGVRGYPSYVILDNQLNKLDQLGAGQQKTPTTFLK